MFTETNQISRKWKTTLICNFLQTSSLPDQISICTDKIILYLGNLILQYQNGCVWFQIKLVLHSCLILKSCILFQTKLHSTQFNYHYLSEFCSQISQCLKFIHHSFDMFTKIMESSQKKCHGCYLKHWLLAKKQELLSKAQWALLSLCSHNYCEPAFRAASHEISMGTLIS